MNETAARRHMALQRWIALCMLALVGATWRLWVPQDVFPRVPLTSGAAALPSVVGWIAIVVLVGALICLLWVPFFDRIARITYCVVVGSLVLAVLLDQHRLQSWSYQLLLIGVIMATASTIHVNRYIRWLTVSIYSWSAMSKLDYSFIVADGDFLLDAGMSLIGVSTKHWTATGKQIATAVFPIGELLVAICLLIPKTRPIGVYAAVGMHVALIAIVGPFGLGHEWGVVLWNLLFIGMVWILFREEASTADPVDVPKQARFPVAFLAWAVLFPALEPLGYCDNWPAWGLYATHHARVKVYVAAEVRDRVAEDLGDLVAPVPFDSRWCRVKIDRWSLRALHAPIYPQERFKIGVALGLAERFELDDQIRVIIDSPADRWDGRRSSVTLDGRTAIADRATAYTFNALPR